ncbi:HAMP domain-containing histidine kinase [Candidatus Thorarchaeota archaeon]|nr:MAG: HAMP domain-containing histidine kinase [Candidatus Thorarchaeota archaeon]
MKRLRESVYAVLASLSLSLILYAFLSQAWDSFYTGVAVHVAIAVSCVTGATWIYSLRAADDGFLGLGFFSALLFRGVVNLALAVEHTLIPDPPLLFKTTQRISVDLLEHALFFALILAGMLARRRPSGWRNSFRPPAGGIVFSILAYTILSRVIFPHVGPEVLLLSATVFALVALALCIPVSYVNYKKYGTNRSIHFPFLLVSVSLLASSIVADFLALSYVPLAWTLSAVFEIVGMFSLTLSLAIPIYRDRVTSQYAVMWLSGSPLFVAITPLIVHGLGEIIVPGYQVMNIGAYFVSHGGTAILSMTIALLLLLYSRNVKSWNLYPLVVLYLSWAVTEVQLTFFWRPEYFEVYGESLVPYLLSAIFSLYFLFLSIQWTKDTPESAPFDDARQWIGLRVGSIAVAMWIGEYIEDWVIALTPGLQGVPFARSAMILVSVVAVAQFAQLVFVLIEEGRSWDDVEVLSTGLLALWIVPGVLKGIFVDWSLGWWAGEMMFLGGLLAGPALLAYLYLQSMENAKESSDRAHLYADLLIHDVGNVHQAIATSVGLAMMDGVPDANVRDILEQANLALNKADRLVRNVRQLVRIDEESVVDLKQKDLLQAISEAEMQTRLEFPDESIDFSLDSGVEEAWILADDLLDDLFVNIFRNATQYSQERTCIEVSVRLVHGRLSPVWQIEVADQGRGISPERKKRLFKRFMEGASGMGLGLSLVQSLVRRYGGEIDVFNRVESDYRQGTIFRLTFPARERNRTGN